MKFSLKSFIFLVIVFIGEILIQLYGHTDNFVLYIFLAAFGSGDCQDQNWDDGSNTPMRSMSGNDGVRSMNDPRKKKGYLKGGPQG